MIQIKDELIKNFKLLIELIKIIDRTDKKF